MAVSRAEVGTLQSQVNMLETQIASLDNRMQSAGVFVPDYVDKQMAGVKTQVDVFQRNVQTYANEATAKVDQVIQELLIHQQALGQQPVLMTELEQVKETTSFIIVRVSELAEKVEKSFQALRDEYGQEFAKVKTYVDRQDTLKMDKAENQQVVDSWQAYRDGGRAIGGEYGSTS